ncbi:flagellar biosynthetic protein FliO [Kaistia defluvii]|uniref:Flagellar protein FliO/FliZ n=1 Tax=Kaistia defluvii TaxID=410841 RepID=A0ABV2QZ80_9HYPH
MHDYLAPMFGDTGATIAQFVITLVVVLLVILVVFWLIRLFTNGSLGANPARGRQPRLAVLDALPLDQRRRLILVRRDNVEHLILIGGPSDVVVEPGIQRPQQQTRRLEPLRQEPIRQEPIRPDPIRQEPQRPEPVPARAEPAPARPMPQTARAVPPVAEAAARPAESRRPDLAQPADIQPAEAPLPAEASARRPAAVFEEESESIEERVTETDFAPTEPEASFEPAPQPQRAAPPAPSTPPQRPAPEPRTGRGFPSFLSGNRPRHTPTTVEIPPESVPVPRPMPAASPSEPNEGRPTGQRPRPYDPRPLLGSQQTPVAPNAAPAPSVDPARAAPRRPIIPPAPPVISDADPFAGMEDEADRLARFEPIFDLGPDSASADDAHLYGAPPRSSAPSVEPPQPEDAPVAIAEDFIEAPQPESPAPSEVSSSVGDLEKEMARLLGEISNARKS